MTGPVTTPGAGASHAAARDALAALARDPQVVARRWRGPERVADDGARPAAVLVLLGVLDDVPARTAPRPGGPGALLDVLLVARATTLRTHAGQVAFPGGRQDPADAGPVDAALREAHEETGLDPAGVEVLGTLAPLALPVSRHLVTPVLAWWAAPSPVRVVDPAESAHVFRAPVADLVDPARRRTAAVRRARPGSSGAPDAVAASVRLRSPAFVVDTGVGPDLVWGFTGFVLDGLLDALGWGVPWDPSRVVDPTDAATWDAPAAGTGA